MSFWFAKKQAQKPPSKPPDRDLALKGRGTRAQRDAATLNRLGCQACPLKNEPITTPFMAPTLARETDILFVAEAPGRDEDERSGKPLTGPSGKLLRDCIPRGEEKYCSFDNICNCRPPDNRTPVFAEIECCRPRRIKYIEEAKPKLIVGLGVVPLHALLGTIDIKGMRGRLFAIKVGKHRCWFMPTYHPSFILRVAKNKRKPLNGMMGGCFSHDIKRAFKVVRGLEPPVLMDPAVVEEGIRCFPGGGTNELEVLLGLLDVAKKAPEKAIDLETQNIRPYKDDSALLTCAITFEQTTFAFAVDHPKAGWGPKQKDRIIKALGDLIDDDTIKVAHNATFEIEWLAWRLGKEFINHETWHCTQVQAHTLDERRGKRGGADDSDRRAPFLALDFLCWQHFGYKFKSRYKLNKKKMAEEDLDKTLIYNGVDTKYTLPLFYHQSMLLEQEKLYDTYLEAVQRQPTMALMQAKGILVDQKEVKKNGKELGAEIERLEAEIFDLDVVRKFVKDRGVFNPASNEDVLSIFRDYLKRKEVLVQKDSWKIHDYDVPSEVKRQHVDDEFEDDEGDSKGSVGKGILEKIDHPLAKLLIPYRNKTKLKSTYVDILDLTPPPPKKGERPVNTVVFPNGRIHCNFNSTFAETRRTSSDKPNMQNFPQRNDAWTRRQVIADPGHVLVAMDYGQLEGCTAAMCSKDQVLVKALWEDYDIHMDFSIKTVDYYPEAIGGKKFASDKAVMKKFRSKVKNKLVFPAMFGAQNSSIAGYMGMPEDKVDGLMDIFWDMFSGLKEWQDELMSFYYEHGYVASPTGFRRRYPITRNQAINHPIQSVACDIVCYAMVELSKIARNTNRWWLHPVLNIHDDLTFLVPDSDEILEEAITEIYTSMLTPPYSFVNVPLSVSCSIGPTWFDMKEIGKFWSNKDVKK